MNVNRLDGPPQLEIAQVHIDSTAALHEFLEQARAVIASGVDLDAAPHPAGQQTLLHPSTSRMPPCYEPLAEYGEC